MPGLRSHLALRRGLAFGIAGSAAPSFSTLGRLAGRPWRPPSLLRQVLRVRCGRPLRGPWFYMAYGRSLVRNSPRGWTPRSLTTIRSAGRRAVVWCRRRPRPRPEHPGEADAVAGTRLPNTFVARVSACLLVMLPRALARPTRASRFGRVFGAHPRGEFRTSGAAVGQIGTWAAQRPFRYETRRTCLSSEGGHRRLRAATSALAAASAAE